MNFDAFVGTDRRHRQEELLAEAARDRLVAQLPRRKGSSERIRRPSALFYIAGLWAWVLAK
jgi:hypothetical protein